MATGGWEGIRPDLLDQPAKPRGRRTVDEMVRAMNAGQLERDVLAEVTRELDRLKAARVILDWHHRPDRAPRAKDREHAGMLDLTIACRDDLVLAVELKRPDGRGEVSPEQRVWLRAWAGRACVATSLAEVLAHLRRWEVVQ